MALRWLVSFSRARNGRSMAQKLAGELMDAANEAGSAVRKREETHKMAEANKAFAHYRYYLGQASPTPSMSRSGL